MDRSRPPAVYYGLRRCIDALTCPIEQDQARDKDPQDQLQRIMVMLGSDWEAHAAVPEAAQCQRTLG